MSRVGVYGLGAVSPAGWNVAALLEVVAGKQPVSTKTLVRPGWKQPLVVRSVPPPVTKPDFLGHPRLRRANSISQYTVAAAIEALGADSNQVGNGRLRLGIVLCVMAGSVAYSRRFFEETMRDPTTASPLVFPETVFNAPSSHLAAFLGSTGINYTVIGDESAFVQSLAIAADWLIEDKCDGCLVIGAEEMDWIVCDAIRLFDMQVIHSDGAGALYLKLADDGAGCPGSAIRPPALAELSLITDPFLFTRQQARKTAAWRLREQLGVGDGGLLCDSDSVWERSAWSDWPGCRRTIKPLFGEAFPASAAWQCVVACEALQRGEVSAATVSVVGANQAAIGARFIRSDQ